MGRRDAVQFTLEWAAEARRLGAIVDFLPGWETRGNGQAANYTGAVVHHTAFLSSQASPFPAERTLTTGRVDLPGPLCNVAGPWCPESAPRLVVVAAHPANHAGASGGRSMGPLPVTTLFNPRVFGLEIDYAGLSPMSAGQHRAALIFGRALCNVLQVSSEYVRGHAETSITGKWDPGHAPGKTIDLAALRAEISNFQEDDLFTDQDREALNYLKGLISWGFDPTLGKGPAFGSAGELTTLLRVLGDPDALAARIANRLPDGGTSGGITTDDVRAAIRDVLKAGVGA